MQDHTQQVERALRERCTVVSHGYNQHGRVMVDIQNRSMLHVACGDGTSLFEALSRTGRHYETKLSGGTHYFEDGPPGDTTMDSWLRQDGAGFRATWKDGAVTLKLTTTEWHDLHTKLWEDQFTASTLREAMELVAATHMHGFYPAEV